MQNRTFCNPLLRLVKETLFGQNYAEKFGHQRHAPRSDVARDSRESANFGQRLARAIPRLANSGGNVSRAAFLASFFPDTLESMSRDDNSGFWRSFCELVDVEGLASQLRGLASVLESKRPASRDCDHSGSTRSSCSDNRFAVS